MAGGDERVRLSARQICRIEIVRKLVAWGTPATPESLEDLVTRVLARHPEYWEKKERTQ